MDINVRHASGFIEITSDQIDETFFSEKEKLELAMQFISIGNEILSSIDTSKLTGE